MHPTRDATRHINGYSSVSIISIHASHTGCNVRQIKNIVYKSEFQFMHPTRDATTIGEKIEGAKEFQFMHPTRDATTQPGGKSGIFRYFNSCIPHGMQHCPQWILWPPMYKFQFMHPTRDATVRWSGLSLYHLHISIHASHTGCNSEWVWLLFRLRYFNSCIPHGMQQY